MLEPRRKRVQFAAKKHSDAGCGGAHSTCIGRTTTKLSFVRALPRRLIAGVGAQLKIPAATSSKIKPQSHQNFAEETPVRLKIARWSSITTRQMRRNSTRQMARVRARPGSESA